MTFLRLSCCRASKALSMGAQEACTTTLTWRISSRQQVIDDDISMSSFWGLKLLKLEVECGWTASGIHCCSLHMVQRCRKLFIGLVKAEALSLPSGYPFSAAIKTHLEIQVLLLLPPEQLDRKLATHGTKYMENPTRFLCVKIRISYAYQHFNQTLRQANAQ